jgi:hypothetical protein
MSLCHFMQCQGRITTEIWKRKEEMYSFICEERMTILFRSYSDLSSDLSYVLHFWRPSLYLSLKLCVVSSPALGQIQLCKSIVQSSK